VCAALVPEIREVKTRSLASPSSLRKRSSRGLAWGESQIFWKEESIGANLTIGYD